MQLMDERRIRLAYHEAGHAVTGALLGGRVRLAELRDDGSGNTAFAHLPVSADDYRMPRQQGAHRGRGTRRWLGRCRTAHPALERGAEAGTGALP